MNTENNKPRDRAWLRRLVRSVRDWFSGEDARRDCEYMSQEAIAEFTERQKRADELNREAKKWEDWAKRF